MKSENVAGFTLYYPPGEEASAGWIRAACERSVKLIQTRWGLAAPSDCRVYVMTSWRQFLFHSAPWYLKPYLVAVYPFLALKAASIWRYAGGWAIRYGRRQVVGIKPARLLKISDRRYAEHLLIEDRTEEERIQTVACHELTHAFTAHLKLPAWLREGLATLAMEHYLGRRIVSRESLDTLNDPVGVLMPGGSEKLNMKDPRALVRQYVVSYWLTRHIGETKPDLMSRILAIRHSRQELEKMVTADYGKTGDRCWDEIALEVQSHYR
mgnify:FL=1